MSIVPEKKMQVYELYVIWEVIYHKEVILWFSGKNTDT